VAVATPDREVGMFESKPPSPGSGGDASGTGVAAHIHTHRRWAAPLLAFVLLSFSPLPSAASAELLFIEAKLRQQMRAEERLPWPPVPKIAYLISGSARMERCCAGRLGRSTTRPTATWCTSTWRPHATECAELAVALHADPVYS
jgi:beta-glucuronosyltransferase